MKKKDLIGLCVLLSIVLFVLVFDLVSKYVLDAKLALNSVEIVAIPYILDLKLTYNYGAAWGMLAGKQLFLIALSFVFIAMFVWYYIKEKNKTMLLNVCFGFLVGGCLGNLFDRIFLGYVRDFLMFDFWKSFPIFNIADVALCIGVGLFVLYLILYYVGLTKAKKIEVEKPDDSNK